MAESGEGTTRPKGRRRRAWILGAFLALAVAGALSLGVLFRAGLIQRVYVYSDRTEIREPAVASRLRSVLWSAPRAVAEGPAPTGGVPGAGGAPPPAAPAAPRPLVASTGALLYARRVPDRGHDLFFRELTPLGWSAETPVDGGAPSTVPSAGRDPAVAGSASINSPDDEIDPCLSADGQILVFSSDRPGGHGGFDLYWSRRAGARWEEPRNLGGKTNSPYDDTGPTLDSTGSLLVFATRRPTSFLLAPPADWSGLMLDDWKPAPSDLAFARRSAAGVWGEPRPLLECATRAEERDPWLDPSGDFLYFASDRPGGLGGFDLYRARSIIDRDEGGSPLIRASLPENLGKPVNSAYDETSPRIFLGGFALAYVASDPASRSSIILESRTREVESSLEFASIPFRAIATKIAGVAWLAFLGALLVASVFVAVRYRRVWEVSLLARCAALAILIHALILYGFYFWVVSDDIVALARREEPLTEVTVARLLEAKISLETNTLRSETPRVPALIASGRTSLPDPSVRFPDAVAVETPVALYLTGPRPSPALPSFPAPPPPEPEEHPPPEPQSIPEDLVSLPNPTPHEAEPERSVTSAPAAASLKVGADEPRTGPIQPIAEPLEAAPLLPPGEAVELATTQVRAPAPAESPLPPLARSVPAAPRVSAVLPVPAQAPEPTGSESPSELEPLRADAPHLERSLSSANSEAPPRVETTEAADSPSRWISQPLGVERTSQDVADAREIPEVPVLPRSLPPPVAGSRRELPEPLPRAEVATEGGRQGGETERPDPSRRYLAPPGEARAPAASRGPAVVIEMGPAVAPSDAMSPVTSAAEVPLGSAPRPGALVQVALAVPAPLPPGEKLPEAGEASRGVTGSTEVADVLRPPGSSLRKATFREAPTVASPATARLLPASGAGPATAISSAAGLELAAPREAPPASELPPGGSEPPLVRAIDRGVPLPEASPGLREETDLRKVRSPQNRAVLVRDLGGTDATEAAVARGLAWLARHQSRDGSWDVDRFDASCRGCRSPGFLVDCDVAVTALALLSFLGQNHTPLNAESPYRRHTRDAIDWLLAAQRADGCLARDDDKYTMYSHGIATFALGEAYVLTRDERLLMPLRKAAGLIVASQNPSTGGWRYTAGPPIRGDTSVTGWQVLALKSVEGAGIEVPPAVFDRARHWLDVEVGGGTYGGIFGYTTVDEPRVAMVAEGMYARLLLGGGRNDRNIEEAARYIHAETRGGRQLDNLYLLYYGNLALFNYQGWIWEHWNESVRSFLVRSQERGGTLDGSWAPTGPWLESGGRVLATCFATLTLEVYYRYLPLYWQAAGTLPPR